jgi:hypothetical protein
MYVCMYVCMYVLVSNAWGRDIQVGFMYVCVYVYTCVCVKVSDVVPAYFPSSMYACVVSQYVFILYVVCVYTYVCERVYVVWFVCMTCLYVSAHVVCLSVCHAVPFRHVHACM